MSTEIEMVLRLLLAIVLGGVIGFQRERSGKEAGIRTHILICAGAALFTLVSIYGFTSSDPARIAAGIVTGIGFLGAGVILHRSGGEVVGFDDGGDHLGGRWHRPGGRGRPLHHLGSGHGPDRGNTFYSPFSQEIGYN